MNLKDDIIELSELHDILGYQDERSVLKWCKNNQIPIIKLGLKKYISSQLLTYIIDNQLVIFEERKRHQLKITESNKPEINKSFSKYLEKYEALSKHKSSN